MTSDEAISLRYVRTLLLNEADYRHDDQAERLRVAAETIQDLLRRKGLRT